MVFSCILIWLVFQLFGIWPVTGSEDNYIIFTNKQHIGLNELAHDFPKMIQHPPVEYIDLNLFLEDAFDREASGIYKLVPYYQKIYPPDRHQDRYFIQQHPFNGEFQLVKNFDYIYRKNIRTLFDPNNASILNRKDKSTINNFQKYQKNIQALVEKNLKSERRVNSIIEEIRKTKEQCKIFEKNLHQKVNLMVEKLKEEEERIKQKELNIEKEIERWKLKNQENRQIIFDLEKILESKNSLINSQQNMITKLELHLSQAKYQKDTLEDENRSLVNQLKNKNRELNEEKEKKKELMNDQEKIEKSNIFNMEKILNLSRKVNKTQKDFANFLETQYYYFVFNIQNKFKNILKLKKKFRLKMFMGDMTLYENDPDYHYERVLINYGSLLYVEKARAAGWVKISENELFNPNKLDLLPCSDLESLLHPSPSKSTEKSDFENE